MGIPCEICGCEVEPERLEILPITKRCSKCAREKGSDALHPLQAVGEIDIDPETYRELLDSIQG